MTIEDGRIITKVAPEEARDQRDERFKRAGWAYRCVALNGVARKLLFSNRNPRRFYFRHRKFWVYFDALVPVAPDSILQFDENEILWRREASIREFGRLQAADAMGVPESQVQTRAKNQELKIKT